VRSHSSATKNSAQISFPKSTHFLLRVVGGVFEPNWDVVEVEVEENDVDAEGSNDVVVDPSRVDEEEGVRDMQGEPGWPWALNLRQPFMFY
jgi:hypothetical protein